MFMPVVVWGCMGPQAGHNGFCSLHALPAVNEGMLIKRSNVFWPLVYRPLQCAGRLLYTRTSPGMGLRLLYMPVISMVNRNKR